MTPDPPSAASSPESADSISALKTPDSAPHGKLKSTTPPGLCLLTDFHLRKDIETSVKSDQKRSAEWMSSPPDSPARTSATAAQLEKPEGSASRAHAPAYSTRSAVSSQKFGPGGLCLRTSRHSRFPKKGRISPPSSGNFGNAGMWDAGGCLMLNISEAPREGVAFSWSRVIESAPRLGCYLMPRQWRQYLARLLRSQSHAMRTHGLAIIYSPQTRQPGSPWAVRLSWLSRTDSVRWLSGKECLTSMGFAPDWMIQTLRKLKLPEMPSVRKSPSGSRKN